MHQNFFPGSVTTVTIGDQPCGNVVLLDSVTYRSLSCVAPAGPGFGTPHIRVSVAGSGWAEAVFLYDPPMVTAVATSPCDAEAPCSIQVQGTNLGLKNSGSGPEPVVYCGSTVCQQLIIVNSTRLQCSLPLSVVGRCPLVVSLNGQNSSDNVVVDRLCGEGRYGALGGPCGPCPTNAECVALFPVGAGSLCECLVCKSLWWLSWRCMVACVPVSPDSVAPAWLLPSDPHGVFCVCPSIGVSGCGLECCEGTAAAAHVSQCVPRGLASAAMELSSRLEQHRGESYSECSEGGEGSGFHGKLSFPDR